MSLRRRRAVMALTALAAAVALPAHSETALPTPTSLRQAGQAAAAQGEPFVLLVSLPGCPYCELARRNYLLPGRAYSGLHAWQINVNDKTTRLEGFDGLPRSPAEEARTRRALFTPTVLFLGPDGQELAERLVGVASPDFFGAYLDQRLATARQTLARSARPASQR